jgi:dTDP-3-amino-3,4,6-trideoxy-alpha-D-glucose transaminase
MRKLPLVDLQAQYASIKTEVDAAMRAVVESAYFVGGPAVREFETAFASFCEAPHVVSCGNGTDAITIALRGIGIGPGDEVITVANTFIATAEGISTTGAKPVFVDVRADTALIDTTKLEAAITSRTKAIIPVHLYGQPADMDEVNRIARAHKLAVIEDAAQAHGARYKGRRVGSLANAATFSFYPGKNLGAYGDGGAMAFADAAHAKQCAMLRDHGSLVKYVHEMEGVNSRLDTIQAAVLLVKLARLDAWNVARRRVAGWYLERLAGISDLVLPVVADGNEPVWHLFVVRHPRRDAIREAMEKAGIGVGIHYPVPLHLQPAYSSHGLPRGSFPVAEQLADTCWSLPIYAELREDDVERVVGALRAAL